MNIGIFLGHPAHFHLLKNVAINLQQQNINVIFAIKKKDILEDLMQRSGWKYTILRENRKNSKMAMLTSVIRMEYHMFKFIQHNSIDILIGSTLSFTASKINRIPVYVVGEDDAQIVPRFAKLSYPFATKILSPISCNCWKWESKTIHYPSYHELAYLHPNHFTPSKVIVEKYRIDTTKPYFIMRFASLTAHHDTGIKGINTDIAQKLIDILTPYGQIYITSERKLEPQFEKYRIKINPLDMHHVMAFAALYIGDSQTMAAEAGVLGTPFVRFNDFVGRIGYLDELEEAQTIKYVDYLPIDHHYDLGIGIHASDEGSVERLCQVVKKLAEMPTDQRKELYQSRRMKMLEEKIDYAKFLTWFIENYPQSAQLTKEANEAFWKQFK